MKRVNRVVAAAVVMVAGGAFVGGCAATMGGAEGKKVASGVPPISYLVSGPGTVWVRDVNKGALVHSGTYHVEVGSPLLVEVSDEVKLRNPDDGNGVTLVDQVNEEDRYEIWFSPVATGEGKRGPTTRKAEGE